MYHNIKDKETEAYQSLLDYEKEVADNNMAILASIQYPQNDFDEMMYGLEVNGKIEWVDRPSLRPEPDPEVFGVFTVEYIDQHCIDMTSDSYEGDMYIKVQGHEKYLKIPHYE